MSTEQHAKDMHQEVVMYLSGNKKNKKQIISESCFVLFNIQPTAFLNFSFFLEMTNNK